MDLGLILAVFAAVVAVIVIVQSRGRAWLAWAVLALAAIHLRGAF
jgi:hypothetical protein